MSVCAHTLICSGAKSPLTLFFPRLQCWPLANSCSGRTERQILFLDQVCQDWLLNTGTHTHQQRARFRYRSAGQVHRQQSDVQSTCALNHSARLNLLTTNPTKLVRRSHWIIACAESPVWLPRVRPNKPRLYKLAFTLCFWLEKLFKCYFSNK